MNSRLLSLSRFFCGLLAACLLARIGVAAPKKPAAPPPAAPQAIEVTAGPADTYARVPSLFSGMDVNFKTQQYVGVRREEQAAILPDIGNDLQFKLAVKATDNADHTIHAVGAIIDYQGVEIQKLAVDMAVKAGETAQQVFTIKPTEDHPGPFYLAGTWEETNGKNKGTFSGSAGQSNWKLIIEDFELVRYPKPGGPLENSPAAARRGDLGLIVRLQNPPAPVLLPGQRPPAKPPTPVVILPLGIDLPGRPVKIGFWAKAAGPVDVSMQIRDPGVEVRQSRFYDTWDVGPVKIEPGDWHYVEIPMPGYGRPFAQRNPHRESNGVVDYPLSLMHLQFTSETETQLMVDDLTCHSQGEKDGSLFVRAVSTKPTGLLYRNDSLNLAIANAWLWGKPAEVDFTAALKDINGINHPLKTGKTSVAPGDERVMKADVKNLPLGPYQLAVEAKSEGRQAAHAPDKKGFLVYEPTGKPLPSAELGEFLGNRNKVLIDLGIERETFMIPWHSIDNKPSVETYMGSWTFDWLKPDVDSRLQSGIAVYGVLGLTALWADPSTVFNPFTNGWNGNVYVLSSRPIYWEEYVLRTVEQFKGKIHTWVVWDRPDSEVFNATAQQYTDEMLSVAYKAAKEADPNIKLISGGITRDNLDKYLVGLAEAGAYKYLDAIGILPSTAPLSPEDGYMDVSLARAQRVRAQEHIKPEMMVLELGWPTGDDQYVVSEADQALYIPRAYVICRSQGVKQIMLKPDRTQVAPRRDSADLIYPDGTLTGLKPAAISAKVVHATIADAEFVQEAFLGDRDERLSRAYVFKRPDGKILLAAWRCEGESILTLPAAPESVIDAFGNAVTPLRGASGPLVTLHPAPIYAVFSAGDAGLFARALERSVLQFQDAKESAWKGGFAFQLDVGNEADEAAAHYKCDGRVVGPIDSYYHTEYGKHVIDTGRHFTGEESFELDVSAYGDADLMLRKRINYAVPNQMVKVYCEDPKSNQSKYVGQWFAFKRDRRFRWRDIELVIPNDFFKGKKKIRLRFVNAGEAEATSYCYWAAPLRTKTVYVSDMSFLVNTSGYGPGVNRDKNILGGPIEFYNKDKALEKAIDKGIGTNSAATLPQSLVVVPLNKRFKRFKANVGIDTATNGRGSVRFFVGDGTKTLYDSGDMNYYTEPKTIDIDVSDSIILMLWVGDCGDGNLNDIANWASARLEMK
jgi:hypothetical protein